jgi:hypothetical protein
LHLLFPAVSYRSEKVFDIFPSTPKIMKGSLILSLYSFDLPVQTNSICKCWNMTLSSNCDCRVLACWFVRVIPHTWHWCLTTEWGLWICQIYLLVKKAANVRRCFTSFQIFSNG